MPTKYETKNYKKYELGPPWDSKAIELRGVVYMPKNMIQKGDEVVAQMTICITRSVKRLYYLETQE